MRYSRPDHDRFLAARVRHGPRRARPLGELVERWQRSPAARRARRYRRVIDALQEVLDAETLTKLTPVSWRGSVLTIAVADAPLRSELRQFRYQELVDALVKRGTGITRVVFHAS